jgi:hypothetical protein
VWGESYKPLWGDRPLEIQVRVPGADHRQGVWTPRLPSGGLLHMDPGADSMNPTGIHRPHQHVDLG